MSTKPPPLINYVIDRTIIQQRLGDGYVDATALCKAYEAKTGTTREVRHWMELKRTAETLAHLSAESGIPLSDLVDVRKGGNSATQGTWIHPRLAVRFAIWLSDEFGYAVEKWVHDWMRGMGTAARVPYHLQRYMANMTKVPHTHFSMLNEMAVKLIGPLEAHGYTLPENLVPDISEGKMFSKWLREAKGIDPAAFPTYEHQYDDGRRVQARLYPIEILPDFLRHFNETWLPQRAAEYFKDRDPKAVPFLPKILPAPPQE